VTFDEVKFLEKDELEKEGIKLMDFKSVIDKGAT
jgi:hypothetical protein